MHLLPGKALQLRGFKQDHLLAIFGRALLGDLNKNMYIAYLVYYGRY